MHTSHFDDLKRDYATFERRNDKFSFLQMNSQELKRTLAQFGTLRSFAASASLGPVRPVAYVG